MIECPCCGEISDVIYWTFSDLCKECTSQNCGDYCRREDLNPYVYADDPRDK